MGSLKRIVWRIAGLSSAVGTIAVSGRIIIFLAFGLIAVLALTGTLGSDRYRDAARQSWPSSWAGPDPGSEFILAQAGSPTGRAADRTFLLPKPRA